MMHNSVSLGERKSAANGLLVPPVAGQVRHHHRRRTGIMDLSEEV